MSRPIWTQDALRSETRPYAGPAWRFVEAQHRVSTLKLVDSLTEQAALEEILEATKPPLPEDCRALDYLLAAPFRYRPYPAGSRFRRAGLTPGVWYGAEAPETAAAEMVFYRFLFYAESPDTPFPDDAAEYTAFSAEVATPVAVDLTAGALATDHAVWTHLTDYAACQALADEARAIGAEVRRVVLGRDCRASSEALARAVAEALMAEGVEVLDLGLSGTEEMYFATTHFGADGGVCVTASHNPMDYNGMKMVRAGSAPLDAKTGLTSIRTLAEADDFGPAREGHLRNVATEARAAYVERVLSFVDVAALRPLTILVNAGNGAVGPTFDAIADALAARGAPLRFIRMHHGPDGSFPNGILNPLLPENQPPTAEAVRAAGADFGVAWDGDFDRCFFFDHAGQFIAGEYLVGLLAEVFLAKEPGATIIHDPRVVWNTLDVVERAGGKAMQSRTGHAFIKQAMRDHGAVYGGEMSAHHYFRDFCHCDSGMIPWLMIAELVSRKGALRGLVAERRAAFPSSGEINFTLDDVPAAMARVRATFEPQAQGTDETDGLSLDMGTWRFNLRASNTEPVLRLNVESRGDSSLLADSVARVLTVVDG